MVYNGTAVSTLLVSQQQFTGEHGGPPGVGTRALRRGVFVGESEI